MWVLGCAALVLAIGVLVLVRGLAVLARHRAETAADFAALAAATRIGTGGDPCAAARQIAAANAALLRSCAVSLGADGRTGTVRVEVVARAYLPVVGERSVTARARAERLPGTLPTAHEAAA
jgi:secretion/DNA translocation related TadE-like protein